MDDSFTRWRGGNKSVIKSRNVDDSFVISDSEDDLDVESITRNNKSNFIIEDSDSDFNNSHNFTKSRLSTEIRGSDRELPDAVVQLDGKYTVRIWGNTRSGSNHGGNACFKSSSSADVPAYQTKQRKYRIYDDSVTNITYESEEQNESTKNNDRHKPVIEYSDSDDDDSNFSNSRPSDQAEGNSRRSSVPVAKGEESQNKSIDSDNDYRDFTNSRPSDQTESNTRRSLVPAAQGEGSQNKSIVELDQSAIFGVDANPNDRSYLTFSDSSDVDETSNSKDSTNKFELSSRVHASSSSFTSTSASEDDLIVRSLIQKEVGIGNNDPFIAQQRAILSCNIQQIKSQLAKSKMLLNTANIALLPDKGEKLRQSINVNEAKLLELSEQWESLSKVDTTVHVNKPEALENVNTIPHHPWKGLPGPKDLNTLGHQALATQQREQALTEERLKDLHGSLNARPSENERAEDPKGLKINLMPHQQHALAWLLWREKQKPHGGILADDMGLGKTLTMISLILTTMTNENSDENDESENSDDEWVHRKKSIRPQGGTLVVCPASVLSQWEGEINRRVKRGMLSVDLFHGNNRETVPRRLAKNDVVITTYNLISREYNKGNSKSVLHEIKWKRIILDEAHIVRNPNSQASEAVCNMRAHSRWALTGTPIQNKELDLYALLKFLKCSPFDDLRVWKRWVDNKNAHGHERLATVMKTLMLRRTKQELQSKGGLGNLPDKNFEEIEIKLDPEEQLVYEKVLVFSRTLFAQFLHQRAEKQHMFEVNSGKFDAPTFLQKSKNTQFTKVQNQLLASHADVKAHEILVLLLRLRQICCQPALIKAMLDRDDLKGNDIVYETGENSDLLSGIGALKLEDDENIDPNEIGVDRRVVEDLLTSKNPVFDPSRQSSKIRAVLNTIQDILDKGDKLIVVSQWTSMLEIIRTHLSSLRGATYDILSGSVPVKKRQHIIDSFNKIGSAPQILLLSLTAGGVGLNLIGGNHLLLLDIHWNPQLEAQAQDRIYRVGQTKSVYIYKFLCLDTIEQRIKALQEYKLSIANDVLTGSRAAAASKLTLDDLKSLFGM